MFCVFTENLDVFAVRTIRIIRDLHKNRLKKFGKSEIFQKRQKRKMAGPEVRIG